ncbi:hypothetical protein YA0089_19010 [Pseudomonas viridiflava]|uniref:hypothetical protein n=1 Tax=Pseudomonas viridiflava TaxID=33069 RepID=UPI0018E62C6F|nr:hypothetical protein [Pseudomonas viridiflava]MBI6725698.1 hypothetical protein [Pseudomonas viridiflava]
MLPPTSPKRYISGISALNIPSDSGTGDWHTFATLRRPTRRQIPLKLVGDGQDFNSNTIFGSRGVVDCTEQCEKYGIPFEDSPVYAANHIRALADMVVYYAGLKMNISSIPLNDWLNTENEKKELFELLQYAKGVSFFEEINKWISQHST